MSAAGVSPVTRSSASFVGSTGGDHSPLRQPKPRSQRPSGTDFAAAATRATASSSDCAPSRRTSRRATDHVGKWTCASLNPGRTHRPPRSTRSGLGSTVSCVPTPPAIHSPAIASARATGRLGSIVRTTPFSRITGENLDVFDHVTIRVSDRAGSERFYDTVLPTIGLDRTHSGERYAEWVDFSLAQASDEKPVTRRLHVGFTAPSRDHVDEFWRAGTAAGFRDDGAPGPRPQYSESYYGAFLLDPDGNSAEAVHHDSVRTDGHVDHLWIRVADVDASRRFYERAGAHAGFGLRRSTAERAQFVGSSGSFFVGAGAPLTEHVHLGFAADDDGSVDAFHRALTEAGYRDNGAPGERPVYHPGYYAAFVLDPDGNNVELVNHNRRS